MKHFKRYFLATLLTMASVTLYAVGDRVGRFETIQADTLSVTTLSGTTVTGTTSVSGGNLQMTGNSLISTDTNGNINLNPDGTGLTIFSDLTATTVPYLGASKELLSSAVTPTELGYVSGVTSSLCGATQTCTLSGKTVSLVDGAVGTPSLTFDSDTNSGLYWSGADTWEMVAGGISALQVKVGSSYANIGSPTASASDSYPLVFSRSVSTGVFMQLSNSNTGASATSGIEIKADSAADSVILQQWPSASTVDAYSNRGVLRTSGSSSGISLVGSAATTDIRFYTGGVTSTEKRATVDDNGLNLHSQSDVRFEDASGGQYIGFSAPATVSSSVDFTLPDADGASGEYLKTNGSGTLSWGAPPGSLTVATQTGSTLNASTGHLYLMDTTSNAITANLPTAVGADGEIISFKVIDNTNAVTLDGSTTETIDGSTTFLLYGNNDVITIRSDGANWVIESVDTGHEIDFTPSLSGFTCGSCTYNYGWWMRDGKFLILRLKVALSSSTMTGPLVLTLPNSLAIDNSLIATDRTVIGFGNMQENGGSNYLAIVSPTTTTTATIRFLSTSGSYLTQGNLSSTVPFSWGNSDWFSIYLRVPISGW